MPELSSASRDAPARGPRTGPAATPTPTVASAFPGVTTTRIASIAVVIAFTWLWHARTTRGWSPSAWLVSAGVVLASVAFGRVAVRCTRSFLPDPAGLPFVLVTGFLGVNTLLFALVLASPFGMAVDVAIVAAVAALLVPVGRWPDAGRPASRAVEVGGLAAVVLCATAATLWATNQQPMMRLDGPVAVIRSWPDVFIHVREISAFAQSHGLRSIVDIKMSGQPAPVYHFAPYMVPAALNAVGATSALDAYGAFQLPFAILMMALTAFCLAWVFTRDAVASAVAAIVVAMWPDAYEQGFNVRYLSFQFMSQVNLGMLYGIACIGCAWICMIEGCRRNRLPAIALAYALLAACATYKAHLFVANALLLLVYPCLFFGRHSRRWRVGMTVVAIYVFMAAVYVGQLSSHVPTIRLDGSGVRSYVDILHWSITPNGFTRLFDRAWDGLAGHGLAQRAVFAAFLWFASFGLWGVVAPWVLARAHGTAYRRVSLFAALVVANYLAMSMFLALDERGIGSPEEFVNRPHAWAYFVVVVTTAALATTIARRRAGARTLRFGVVAVGVVAAVGFVSTRYFARDIETFTVHPRYERYADPNALDACLVDSAHYVRDHAGLHDVFEDSRLDPRFVVTSLAERQIYVSDSTFAAPVEALTRRTARLRGIVERGDVDALRRDAAENGVRWFVLHPIHEPPWPRDFLATAVHTCGGFRVFDLAAR